MIIGLTIAFLYWVGIVLTGRYAYAWICRNKSQYTGVGEAAFGAFCLALIWPITLTIGAFLVRPPKTAEEKAKEMQDKINHLERELGMEQSYRFAGPLTRGRR